MTNATPYSFTMPKKDVSVYVLYHAYSVTLINDNPDASDLTLTIGHYMYHNTPQEVAYGEEVACNVWFPKKGYVFLGWFDENDECVSTLSTFSFEMPRQNLVYTAKWQVE